MNINRIYLHIDIEILLTFTGKHYTESKDVGAVVISVFFFFHSATKEVYESQRKKNRCCEEQTLIFQD